MKSYYITVDYISDPYKLFESQVGKIRIKCITRSFYAYRLYLLDDIQYTFDVISRPEQQIRNILVVIMMFFFLLVFGEYIYIVYSYNKKSGTSWLSGSL